MNDKIIKGWRFIRDYLGQILCWLASSLTIAICLGIILYLFLNGFQKLNLEFLITEPNPTFNEAMSGGILTPILGTLILTVIGTLLAFPWALATSIYLAQYAGKNFISSYFRLAIDVLSGIPTIVIAIFGLAIFSNPIFSFLSSKVDGVEGVNKAFGRSFLVAGITMAVMVLPFIIKTCEEAIKAVPNSYMEASLAMGASKWHTIIKVILPSAKSGIATGVVLGMGRIIGDTAIVWLTLGGTLRMTGIQPWWQHWVSTMQNTGSTLTSYIFYTSPAGEGNMTSVAFAASLVLIGIIIILNLITDVIARPNKMMKGE